MTFGFIIGNTTIWWDDGIRYTGTNRRVLDILARPLEIPETIFSDDAPGQIVPTNVARRRVESEEQLYAAFAQLDGDGEVDPDFKPPSDGVILRPK